MYVLYAYLLQQDVARTYNVTLCRVRVTIAATQMQRKVPLLLSFTCT
jgi:hypothetical protein